LVLVLKGAGSLRQGRVLQIDPGFRKKPMGLSSNPFAVLGRGLANDPPRGANNQRIGRYDRPWGHDGAGGYDGTYTYDGMVKDDGANADENTGADDRAVNDGPVTDDGELANRGRGAFGRLYQALVEDGGVPPDDGGRIVSSQNGHGPYAHPLFDSDVADHPGGKIDKCTFVDLGHLTLEGRDVPGRSHPAPPTRLSDNS